MNARPTRALRHSLISDRHCCFRAQGPLQQQPEPESLLTGTWRLPSTRPDSAGNAWNRSASPMKQVRDRDLDHKRRELVSRPHERKPSGSWPSSRPTPERKPVSPRSPVMSCGVLREPSTLSASSAPAQPSRPSDGHRRRPSSRSRGSSASPRSASRAPRTWPARGSSPGRTRSRRRNNRF